MMDMNIRFMNIDQNEQEVLRHIATKGPCKSYDLIKTTLNTTTAYTVPRRLVKKGYLRSEPIGRSDKAGRIKEKFHLTPKGLVEFLLMGRPRKINRDWNNLLPLVLGKWKYFYGRDLVAEMENALKYVTRKIVPVKYLKKADVKGYQRGQKIKRDWLPTHDETNKYYEQCIMGYFFEYIFQAPKALETKLKWYEAIRGDQDLRKWAIDSLMRQIDYGLRLIERDRRILRVIESPDIPNWGDVEKEEIRWMEGGFLRLVEYR